MKKIYNLLGEEWRSDFFYAYGPQAKSQKKFTERNANGALYAGYNEDIKDNDYISAITLKKYPANVEATVRCTYRGTGAPLIVFSDDLVPEGDILRYRLHFEAVAYSGGCNVWHIVPRPENKEWPVKSTKIAFEKFPIREDEEIEMTVRIVGKTLTVSLCGKEFSVEDPEFPENFHIGFTACEGECSFSRFTVEEL